MKLTLEQFETKWAENNLSVTDWFDTTYGLFNELEALQSRSCEGCIHRSELHEGLTNGVTNGFCVENGFFTRRGFCCNRYEAKDNQ